LGFLGGFLPDALLPAAERLIISTYAHTSTAVVSVSAIGALWSSSRGVYGLLRGLNAIYGVEENRGFFYTRLISMFYTFLLLIILVLTVTLNVFGEAVVRLLTQAKDPFWRLLSRFVDLRQLLLLILQTALFCAMFMALPNRKNSFRSSLPGALLTALGWLIFTDLFSYYVEHFSAYSHVYGSVYAVALSMLWLYCCLSILFYGGALNRLLSQPADQ
jgi:membrane protein